MRKMKKCIAIILVLSMTVIAFTGCGKKDDKKENATFTVGFSNNNDLYDYCVKFRELLVKYAKEENMNILVTNADGDTNKQNEQVETFILQDAKAVSAISNDLDGSVPALEAAKDADIPYITFLTTVRNGDDYGKYIYIGSENYDAGYLQGEYLCETLPENAEILYMTGNPNDQQCIDRRQGFMDGLAKRSDITILSELSSENTKDLGISLTEDWMQVYDSFDAIVGQNDESILGAIEALKGENRLKGVITVGLDGSDAALESIIAGELTMSVLQDADAQAKAGVEVFKQIRDGVDPTTIKDVKVPFMAVDAKNVGEYHK